MKDPLEQLALLEVPEPPAEFDRQLHRRLNQRLIVQHLADLLLRAMPWAILEMARAALGLFGFTLTGRFDDERRPGKRDA